MLNTNLNLGLDSEKDGDNTLYDKYDFLNTPGLSDYTKAYLTTHTSSIRPELNDYTKAYLDSLSSTNNETNIRPELTNLTKEYLSQNTEEK